jgi:hypothetical protein
MTNNTLALAHQFNPFLINTGIPPKYLIYYAIVIVMGIVLVTSFILIKKFFKIKQEKTLKVHMLSNTEQKV